MQNVCQIITARSDRLIPQPHVTSRDPSVTRQQKQADTFPESRQDTTNMGDIQVRPRLDHSSIVYFHFNV